MPWKTYFSKSVRVHYDFPAIPLWSVAQKVGNMQHFGSSKLNTSHVCLFVSL